jgi:hypothetical protein
MVTLLTTIIARSWTSSFQGFEATVIGVRTGGTHQVEQLMIEYV